MARIRTGRPNGRPPMIDSIAAVRADGTEVTVSEQLIERIRMGLGLAEAANTAGVSRESLHKWRLAGARARAEQIQGKRITPAQKRLVQFVGDCERAEDEAELSRLAIISRAMNGGFQTRKETVKTNAAGEVIEKTVVTETLRPEWTAAAWWLERRRHQKYARRVEVTGAEGAPLIPPAEAARGLADSLREFMAGAAAASEAVSPNSGVETDSRA